jgi:hypothetical protein
LSNLGLVLSSCDQMGLAEVATWSSTVINTYFIVAFTLCDIWTWRVLGFKASPLLCEMLRFFGITTLLIVLIHAQVASGYPRDMMLRAFVGKVLIPFK